jgi:hypothetical protein
VLGRDGKTGEQVRHSPEVDGEEPADDPTATPVMPAPPFPAFQSVPTLPQQAPGVGFESGRDSRAR